MPFYDLPRSELVAYCPDLPWPKDMEEFWSATLAESRAIAGPPVFARLSSPLTLVDTFDATFSGFGGDEVRAWLHLPTGAREPLPAVVRFIGYGGGRGLAHEVSTWTLAGYACLTVDNRGQGSGWSPGDTADPAGAPPSHPGFMTRGILDPHDYFFRRLYTDAVLAVDAVRTHPMVRPDRVAVTGSSQGGGMSLAAAALVPDLWAVMADVPFLCDFRRATEIVEKDPYTEIVRYLSVHRDHTDRVFSTLAYFDVAALAKLANAPALFSVALMDQICPPSTVYAAYNRYGGPKEMREYAFNDHEGGEGFQQVEQLHWLASLGTAGELR